MLILAGITINAILGQNSIFNSAQQAKVETEKSTILEAVRLKLFTGKAETINKDFDELNYLKTNNYIDNNSIINVSEISDSISTGKGNEEQGDYYYIADGNLYYKDSSKTEQILGKLFDVGVIQEDTGHWLWYVDADGKAVITGLDV